MGGGGHLRFEARTLVRSMLQIGLRLAQVALQLSSALRSCFQLPIVVLHLRNHRKEGRDYSKGAAPFAMEVMGDALPCHRGLAPGSGFALCLLVFCRTEGSRSMRK